MYDHLTALATNKPAQREGSGRVECACVAAAKTHCGRRRNTITERSLSMHTKSSMHTTSTRRHISTGPVYYPHCSTCWLWCNNVQINKLDTQQARAPPGLCFAVVFAACRILAYALCRFRPNNFLSDFNGRRMTKAGWLPISTASQ